MAEQRIVIGMMDGVGVPIYRASEMPTLNMMEQEGNMYAEVTGVFPSVTNVNNASIACGAWPSEHGITANSFYDQEKNEPVYMNGSDLITIKTIFERASEKGIKSALLTSKKKTAELFSRGTTISIAAEAPDQEVIDQYGIPPEIYSREINYWLWDVAIDILENRPEIGLIYVHITDYPIHAWHENSEESREHLREVDRRIGEAFKCAPDAAFFFTADHGMNNKTRCYDLFKLCENRGVPVKFVLSPERDYYIKHHRNFTGCSWIWLKDEGDRAAITFVLQSIPGVDLVMNGSDVADTFHTIHERIGDLVVFGDRETMFGEMDTEFETLPDTYRAHGSLYEMDLPLIIFNYKGRLPYRGYFTHNRDLIRFLF